MKAPYLLQLVGLPALVLAGLGVGAAAAKYGATDSEFPRNCSTLRIAVSPTFLPRFSRLRRSRLTRMPSRLCGAILAP